MEHFSAAARFLIVETHTHRKIHLVWFKRDLRTHDHAALSKAWAASQEEGGCVLPLYIVQDEVLGAPDSDARHWGFIRESLIELRQSLAERGAPLVVRRGQAVDVLHELHQRHSLTAIYSHEETGNLLTYAVDRAVAAWARSHRLPWYEFPQNGVIRQLKSRTGWAVKWERRMAQPIVETPPSLPPLPGLDPGEIPVLTLSSIGGSRFQKGGEARAHKTLQSFLNDRGTNYSKNLSSPVTAWQGCSRLSPHLAWGTISLKCVVQAARVRAEELREIKKSGGNIGRSLGSLRAFTSRLHWRCHFQQKLEDQPDLEIHNLWRMADGLRPGDPDPAMLKAWKDGMTGYPFLDACLRAVRETGWMNFRMRAMMVSFASYDLWLHWREPALHLARCFLDYEPGIHYPQVQMQSGTTGINTLRMYDPVKQGLDHDAEGVFVRRWVPELARVPLVFLHQPWLMSEADQLANGLRLGRDYPLRIVDHKAAVAAAKEQLYPLRRGRAAKEEADAIQLKHGSRKSGLTPRTRKPKPPHPQGILGL
ncbi:MAG: deoxyribodipyrimidine photo-lyase [Terrimicrobiaceae bacterium]